MIKSKKALTAFYIIAILFSGCASKITIAKINKPAYENLKKTIKHDKIEAKQYIEGDPDIVEKIVGEDKYFFERQIKIRNKIVDSLSLLKKDKFMIIDSRIDNNGQRMELSYFFYDDKINFVWFNRKDSISNGSVFTKFSPVIENVTREHLEKTKRDILLIYDSLNENNPPTELSTRSDRSSYLITKVSEKVVGYYSLSTDRKVVKLNWYLNIKRLWF
jgi:hypothetical protein